MQFWDKAAAVDPNFPSGELLNRVQKMYGLLQTGQREAAEAELTALEKDHARNPHFHLARGTGDEHTELCRRRDRI